MLPHRFSFWFLLTHSSPKTIQRCHEFVAIYISTTDTYSICINFHLFTLYSYMVNQYFLSFILFNFFSLFITLATSFIFDNLVITFFKLAFWFRQWQASKSLEFTITPVSLKIFRTVPSKLLPVLNNIPFLYIL